MKITEFAALSLGGADWSKAFSEAMNALKTQGGGVLTVPAGVYPTGPIELYSHITLEVQAGAELRFHPDADAFQVKLYGSLCKTGKGHGTDRVLYETLSPVATEVIFCKD